MLADIAGGYVGGPFGFITGPLCSYAVYKQLESEEER